MATKFSLHLIFKQPKERLHTQFDNGALRRASIIGDREPITMNPTYAALRGVVGGDTVRVFNSRGACLAGVRLSYPLRRSVVQLATGVWFDPDEPIGEANLELHGSSHELTRDKGTSRLPHGPTSMTALVEVEKTIGEQSSVRAFRPQSLSRATELVNSEVNDVATAVGEKASGTIRSHTMS